MSHSFIAAGLDVGTTKVCAVAAEISRREIRLLGVGLVPSSGLKKGIIVNMEGAIDSISRAIRESGKTAGIKIKSASVSISGAHIKSFESTGAVGVRGREVSRPDIRRAIDSAKTVYIPLDREILHAIPLEFVLDGQEGITDPRGMCGVRLESRLRILTGAVSPVQNLLKCCLKAGLDVRELVYEVLASAHATLSPQEREAGTLLVDIGGGTTGLAFFSDSALKHAGVIGIGGNHLTNDLAVGLKIHSSEAERVKKEGVAAFPRGASSQAGDREIEVTQPGGQKSVLPGKCITEILQPRCEELLEMIKKDIEGSIRRGAVRSIVFTGGSALLKGLVGMAERYFELPARIGLPFSPAGMSSDFATPANSAAIGLATYDSEHIMQNLTAEERPGRLLGQMTLRAKEFMKNNRVINLISRKEGGVLCLKSRK